MSDVNVQIVIQTDLPFLNECVKGANTLSMTLDNYVKHCVKHYQEFHQKETGEFIEHLKKGHNYG